jgi:hypothetical protein
MTGQLQRLDMTCAQKPMRVLTMPPKCFVGGNPRAPTAGNFPSRIQPPNKHHSDEFLAKCHIEPWLLNFALAYERSHQGPSLG